MTELTNPRSDRVKAVRALSGRSARLRHAQYLVEGPQAVREAVKYAPRQVRDLYMSEAAFDRYPEIVQEAQANDLYLHVASKDVLMAMSPDAQGLVAVLNTSHLQLDEVDFSAVRNVAVLCTVRDPGNAGTIIRAADAAGADLVVLTRGSVELENPKVVRSTAGSMFHLPIVTDVEIGELSSKLRSVGVQILAAAGEGAHDLDDLLDFSSGPRGKSGQTSEVPDLAAPTAWLFGNEAQGLSDLEFELSDYAVRVPLRGKAESLNVATAATVCLYATSRAQR